MEVNMALDRIKKIEESIEIQEDPQTFVEQLEAARACGQKLGLLQAQVAIKESYDDAQIEIRSLESRLYRTQCYLEMSQSDCRAHYNHVLQLQEKLNEAARGSPNGELWNLRTKENRHDPRRTDMSQEKRTDISFGEALQELKNGGKVSRSGWNGKGLWLELQQPDANSKMTLPYIYLNYPGGNVPSDRPGCVVTASAYPEGARVPWLASQTDMLADDWEVVE
jgi:hypothetical protein